MKLLFALFEQGITGVIYIKNIDLLKVLYFSRGKLVWGSSNSDEDRLDQILLTKYLVTEESITELKKEAKEDESLGKLLVEKGLITVEELIGAYRDQVKQIILSILRWADGSYQFVKEPPPQGILNLELSIIAFAMDYIVQEVDVLEIWGEIESVDEMVKASDQVKVAKYHLSEKQLEFLNCFDGNTNLENILSNYTGGQREASLKLIYFFFMAGLLAKKGTGDLPEEKSSLFEDSSDFDVFDGDTKAENEPMELALEEIAGSVEDALSKTIEPAEQRLDEAPVHEDLALEVVPGTTEPSESLPDEVEAVEAEPVGPGPIEIDLEEIAGPSETEPEEVEVLVERLPGETAEPGPVEIPPEEIAVTVDTSPDETQQPIEPEPIEAAEPIETKPITGDLPDDYGEDMEMYADEGKADMDDEEMTIPALDEKPLVHPMEREKKTGKAGEKKKSRLFRIVLISIFIVAAIGGFIYYVLPWLAEDDTENIMVKKPVTVTPKQQIVSEKEKPPDADTKKIEDKKDKTTGTKEKIQIQLPKPKPKVVIPETPRLSRDRASKYFREGKFTAAGNEWKEAMKRAGIKYSILLELDCMKESVTNAYRQIALKDNFFILNRKRGGRNCYLVLWGTFAGSQEANAALKSIPNYFWEQDAPPTVIDLGPYLF